MICERIVYVGMDFDVDLSRDHVEGSK